MGDPRRVRPDEVEIIAARELRKAGLEVSRPRLLARHALSDDGRDYSVALAADAVVDGTVRPVLIEFRNQPAPVDADAVRALSASHPDRASSTRPAGPKRLIEPSPSDPAVRPPVPPLRVLFSASGYEPAAVREARSSGVVLLAIADGPAAFRRSQWSMGEQPPAWVPEYMAEIVDLAPDGTPRQRLVTSGTKL